MSGFDIVSFDDSPGGFDTAEGVIIAEEGVRPSGGIPTSFRVSTRSRRDIAYARRRFGIEDEYLAAIVEVAISQVARLEDDPQKRFEELHRELELRKLQWDGRYLEVLAEIRRQMIDEEIAERLSAKMKKIKEEEILALVFVMASL